MKKSLEQQLIDKCSELNIELDMDGDRIWMDAPPHHQFGTNATEYEHCIILDQDTWEFDNRKNSKKYNYSTTRNESIRIMLEAVGTLMLMGDDDECENEDCEKCYEQEEE